MDLNVVKSGTWGTCLWGIDDTGFLLIGEGTGASIYKETDAPWHELRGIITELKFVGNVNMPEDGSLREAFKDCKLLGNVDASTLDTYQVVDMGSMFENCINLKELSLTSFDTTNVKNMNKMFYGCRALTNLDLSTFNTVEVADMRDMFAKCNKLHNLTLGDRFSTVGNGKTSCGNLAIRDTGRYRMAKVVDVVAGMIIYHSNDKNNTEISRQSITGFRYLVEDNTFPIPRQDCTFHAWNTKPNGKGTTYMPGDEIENIEDDIDLYAIWVAPPMIGTLAQPEPITYGSPLKFEIPEIITETDDTVTGYIEISPSGRDRTWRQIEYNTILPVSYNGYLMRLVAYNDYGIAYSNPVNIRINKARFDFTKMHWAENEDMTYDGNHKSVWLDGIPEGVKVSYEGNSAVAAGTYTAIVTLDYDKDNYESGIKVKPYTWEIKKAKYDMSEVAWDYSSAFEYDGTQKVVRLTGLPEGVTAMYQDNFGTDVDIRTAEATFKYDVDNYEKPEAAPPCVWEIRKAYLDANSLEWTNSDEFIYDGMAKKVVINNLPENADVEYYGNEETAAGKYLARAVVSNNYYTNGPIECEWAIKKARYNMSTVHWTYNQPITYDRTTHEIGLVNVPTGVSVRYFNHIAMDSGEYNATAAFVCNDSHNYETPADMSITWTIKKAIVDMSNVTWNYVAPFEYDGGTKTVELVGLPEEVYAIIENGSASRAGVYIAHADLKYDENNYEVEQPADCQWQINKAKFDVSNIHWSYTHPFTYNGEEKIINLVNVPEGLNVEYQNNVKMAAGKYVATAKLTPSDLINYEIPVVNGCTWSINKSALEKIDIVWSDDRDFVFDGTEKTVRIISEITDMIRIEYQGAEEINAGEHEAIATFYSVDEDNFEAPTPVRHRWSIQKSHFDIGGVVWDYTSKFTYDGNKKEVKLVNVPEGLVVRYENNSATEVGEYTAIARFEIMDENNYYPLEPLELHWSIQKATYDLSKTRWQDENVFQYDESVRTIELTGVPQGLVPIYQNNVASEAGEYLASVEFNYDEHNYERPTFCDCRWRIEKSSFALGGASWDYEEPFKYDGTEKHVRVINLPDGATIRYTNDSAVNHGVYTASADVSAIDNDNYMVAQMPDLVWRIEKGEYDMSQVHWDYDSSFEYDGTEKSVVLKGLPNGVTPVYQNNVATNAGQYLAKVTFKIDDYENYNVPTFTSCEWKINKIDYDMSAVEWDCKSAFTYDGRMKEVTLRGLPEGVRATLDGNFATSVGKYTASAEFQISDPVNYNEPVFPSCNWEIKKADYDMSHVYWLNDGVKQYNGRMQSIFLENLPNGITCEYSGNEGCEVGIYTAKAILKVEDEASYNTPKIKDCEWEIVKADLDMSNVAWDFVPGSFVYDGNLKKVALINLPDCLEAKYSGETARGAGQYTATAEFTVNSPNFNVPETIAFDWYIDKAECDMSNVRWDYTEEFVYDALPHGIEVTGLPNNVTVSYEDNRKTDAGVYTAVARFKADTANFITPDPMTCQWNILQANCDVSTIRWDYDQSFLYDGTTKRLALAGVPDLLEVQYYGNEEVNAGIYTAHADFIPVDSVNYRTPESTEFVWEIRKATYDMGQTLWSNERSFVYNGDTKIVVVEGYPEGVRPVYSGNTAVNAGNYHAEVSFEYDEQNYLEPHVLGCDWNIVKNTYDMSSTYWNYTRPFVYNEREKRVELEGVPEGITPIYSNNIAIGAGEYVAEVSFGYDEMNYEEPVFGTCTWKIEQAEIPVDFDKLEWEDGSFVYDGQPHRVELKEIVDEQSFLNKLRGYKQDAHIMGIPSGFEVVYEDNEMTEVGNYYARAILKPIANVNYKERELPAYKWEIRKAIPDMSNVRWSYVEEFVYDGYRKSVELIGLPDVVTAKYENNSAINAGMYEAQAILVLEDEHNYEKPRAFKGCLWKIRKAKHDMSDVDWEYFDDLTYDGDEKSIELSELPDGVSLVSYRGNTATDAGNYTAEAILTCDDPDNYETPKVLPMRWRIHRQKINTDDIFWNYNEGSYYAYNGQVKTVELVGLPEGVSAVYMNNQRINAGNYIAKARLVYDTKNFYADEVPDLVWKIEKANFDTSNTFWDYEGPFEYDGHEKRIYLRNVPSGIDVRYMDNRATAIGSYTAKAYLSYNTDNYREPNIERTIEWEIIR